MSTILSLKNVSKLFGGVRAVDDFTYDFERGKITALIGPNGAGKTTAFNLIGGHLQPDTGTVTFEGQKLSRRTSWGIASLGIGRLFQDVRLFGRMTVLDNVMTAFPGQRGESFSRGLSSLWTEIKQEKSRQKQAMELLEMVGLANKADALAENISFGQQKLVALVRAFATNAKLLLLDEPTTGVNPGMIRSLLDTVKTFAEKDERTIIFVEHNIEVVRSLAHKVVFMTAGKIQNCGTPSDVLSDPKVRTMYVGQHAA